MKDDNQEIEVIYTKIDSLSRQVDKLREAVVLIHNTANKLIDRIESYEEKIRGVNQAVSFIQNIAKLSA